MDTHSMRILSLALLLTGLVASVWHTRLLYIAIDKAQPSHRADKLKRPDTVLAFEAEENQTDATTTPIAPTTTTARASTDTEATTSSSTAEETPDITTPASAEALPVISSSDEELSSSSNSTPIPYPNGNETAVYLH